MQKFLFLSVLILFFLEINAQTVAVSSLNMNSIYIGISNPITIAIEGVADEKINVTVTGGDIQKYSRGHYNVIASRPGEMYFVVEWEGKRDSFKARVKLIPDPIAAFKKCQNCRPEGIVAEFKNADFYFGCSIQSYVVSYQPKNNDPIQVTNKGSDFNETVKNLMKKAKIGDVFRFTEILTRCPGDDSGRSPNDLTYVVKN